jgi:hypothetical protein
MAAADQHTAALAHLALAHLAHHQRRFHSAAERASNAAALFTASAPADLLHAALARTAWARAAAATGDIPHAATLLTAAIHTLDRLGADRHVKTARDWLRRLPPHDPADARAPLRPPVTDHPPRPPPARL